MNYDQFRVNLRKQHWADSGRGCWTSPACTTLPIHEQSLLILRWLTPEIWTPANIDRLAQTATELQTALTRAL